jgi:hypothetical protein
METVWSPKAQGGNSQGDLGEGLHILKFTQLMSIKPYWESLRKKYIYYAQGSVYLDVNIQKN